jgi:alpha-beta hydrolase superfamily lysophospholipase
MKLFKHLTLFVVYGGLAIVLAAIAAYVVFLRDRSDLKPWHLAHLDAEFTAAGSSEVRSLDDYRRLEGRVFDQLREQVYDQTAPDDRRMFNRYFAGSLADPTGYPRNWNRTFELEAPAPRGGVLLLHGMSDGPYSLRALGEWLNRLGYHVVGLRLPGHGTAPAGLVSAQWQDFAAATRLGARHLRARIGPDAPLFLVGYSNGAALAVEYALARAHGEELPKADALVLLSPAIGVSPAAALAVWQSRLSAIPGLEKLAWNSLSPEYDPYKYGSFAVNAGDQVYQLTRLIDERMQALAGTEGMQRLPPMLVFQSAADATVSAAAVVQTLLRRLAPAGHELVAFDVNRNAEVDVLLTPNAAPGVRELLEAPSLPFDLTVIRNAGPDSASLVALHRAAGQTEVTREETGLKWPAEVFSLSHVAIPFPPDDPIYGARDPDDPKVIYLGRPELFGERGLLAVPAADLLRLRYNPFYGYLEARVLAFMNARSPIHTSAEAR